MDHKSSSGAHSRDPPASNSRCCRAWRRSRSPASRRRRRRGIPDGGTASAMSSRRRWPIAFRRKFRRRPVETGMRRRRAAARSEKKFPPCACPSRLRRAMRLPGREVTSGNYGLPISFVVLLLAADGLQLGEHGIDIEIVALLLGGLEFRLLAGGFGGRQQGGATIGGVGRLLLGGALHLEIELDLRAQAKRYRVHRGQGRG